MNKMYKIIVAVLTFALAIGLVACTKPTVETEEPPEGEDTETQTPAENKGNLLATVYIDPDNLDLENEIFYPTGFGFDENLSHIVFKSERIDTILKFQYVQYDSDKDEYTVKMELFNVNMTKDDTYATDAVVSEDVPEFRIVVEHGEEMGELFLTRETFGDSNVIEIYAETK